MDLLALILACSIHPDDALVRVMVEVQSGGNAHFVGDLATLKTVDNLSTVADGLRVAETIGRSGGRPAVGLLGLPLEWAARFAHQPKDLFDACTNLAIGSAMLSEYHDQCSGAPQRPAPGKTAAATRQKRRRPSLPILRTCVLTKFAHDLGLKSSPAEILRLLEEGTNPPAMESSAQLSAIFTNGDDGGDKADWSNPRIYLDATAPQTPPAVSAKRPAELGQAGVQSHLPTAARGR